MAAAVPYIMLAGSVMSAVGAVKSSQANAQASLYNEAQSKINASAIEAQGDAATEQQQRDTQRRLGSMVAGYAASGVQLSDGSPADVLADSARSAALDRLTMKYNYKMRALGYTSQANLDSMASKNYLEAGRIGAASALLSSPAYTKFG